VSKSLKCEVQEYECEVQEENEAQLWPESLEKQISIC